MGLLRWAIVAFIAAIIAAVFGFGRTARSAAMMARILFALFITVAIVLLIFNYL
ncbi:MAG: DUF1328 family protein [Anaerolineae bacterium]|jgi:uncharacterized membrane protein YtjA (UPF0391 family)